MDKRLSLQINASRTVLGITLVFVCLVLLGICLSGLSLVFKLAIGLLLFIALIWRWHAFLQLSKRPVTLIGHDLGSHNAQWLLNGHPAVLLSATQITHRLVFLRFAKTQQDPRHNYIVANNDNNNDDANTGITMDVDISHKPRFWGINLWGINVFIKWLASHWQTFTGIVLILLPDNVDPESHRKIRVYLKFMRM